MRETTSSQFLVWKVWLEQEWNELNPLKYFLANIALEARRGWVKNPKAAKIDPFLLKFEHKKVQEVEVQEEEEWEMEEVEADKTMAKSKAYWFGVTGLVTKKE